MSERTCTNTRADHRNIDAEVVVRLGLTYRMLRCESCGKPRGMRLIRRSERTPEMWAMVQDAS